MAEPQNFLCLFYLYMESAVLKIRNLDLKNKSFINRFVHKVGVISSNVPYLGEGIPFVLITVVVA